MHVDERGWHLRVLACWTISVEVPSAEGAQESNLRMVNGKAGLRLRHVKAQSRNRSYQKAEDLWLELKRDTGNRSVCLRVTVVLLQENPRGLYSHNLPFRNQEGHLEDSHRALGSKTELLRRVVRSLKRMIYGRTSPRVCRPHVDCRKSQTVGKVRDLR